VNSRVPPWHALNVLRLLWTPSVLSVEFLPKGSGQSPRS
jgi:hypothetical protein